mmetsp:Transcript_11313/g.31234  ORF Transcript_11313/g.31234 Transcript_11313/m.31234 type:complete len:95 (+) Transcript_11313:435-719(+)
MILFVQVTVFGQGTSISRLAYDVVYPSHSRQVVAFSEASFESNRNTSKDWKHTQASYLNQMKSDNLVVVLKKTEEVRPGPVVSINHKSVRCEIC